MAGWGEGRIWSAAEDAFLIAHYRRLSQREIGRRLGWSPESVGRHAAQLIGEGRLRREDRCAIRPWTAAELAFAREHLGRPGWPKSMVGKVLGRSPGAVRQALYGRGEKSIVERAAQGTLTLADVAAACGVSWSVASRWCHAGLLVSERLGCEPGKRTPFIIRPGHLIDFLREHPECYDLRRLSAPWRKYACRVDPLAGLVSAKAAARALDMPVPSFRRACREKQIDSRRARGLGISPREVFIPEAELARLLALKAGGGKEWLRSLAMTGEEEETG